MGITQSGAASSFQLYLRQSQDLLLTGIPWNASGPLIWFRFMRYREATCHRWESKNWALTFWNKVRSLLAG